MSDPRNQLRAAVVQLNAQADVGKNLERVRVLVSRAAEMGAELVTLPENFGFMGDSDDDKRAIAEDLSGDGPIVSALSSIARQRRIFLLAGGMAEKSGDEKRPYNASPLFGPEGSIVGHYRKIHLFDADLPDGSVLRESDATMPGPIGEEAITVVDVAGHKLGLTICYDLRFPEIYRRLAIAGARMISVPAAFTLLTGKDHWLSLLRARAIENQVFILAPAQHGKHPRGRQTYGKSMIVDPWGEVIAQSSEGEGVAVADLDFGYQDKVRKRMPVLRHRRLD